MAIPWRRDPSTTLESQPWRSITIEGKGLLVKGVFLNSSYSVLCTDLCLMWEEVLDEEKLLDRSKVQNLIKILKLYISIFFFRVSIHT